MELFRYSAIDADGNIHKGVVPAIDVADANNRLFAGNLTPIFLAATENDNETKTKPSGKPRSRFRRVPTEDLILFTKQLNTMIRVGVPIMQTLDTLAVQNPHPRLRAVCESISTKISEGGNLSMAIAEHPDVFPHPYATLVAAGEKSGMLPETLDRLIELVEHEANVKAEVRNAMRYPMLVIGALAVAFVIMVGFVMPKFAVFFQRAGLELPLPTRVCLEMSEFFTTNGILVVVLLVGVILGWRFARRIPRVRLWRDTMLLHMPMIGPVVIKSAMSRFASIFAIMHTSGVMILDSVRILSNIVDNQAIAAEFKGFRESLEKGHGISGPLRESRYFPPLLTNLVAVGEETGRLDEMLITAAAHFDTELRHSMKKLTASIGPILIALLTVVIGFFALAIYLPMWELSQMASQ